MKMRPIPVNIAHRILSPRAVILVGSISGKGVPDIIPITNVTSVCTSPEIIGISVYSQWQTCENLRHSAGFTLSMPTASQLELAWKLGSKYSGYVTRSASRKAREFSEHLSRDFSPFGPVLKESVAWVECCTREKLTHLGDHALFLGEVVHAKVNPIYYDDGMSMLEQPKPLLQWSGNRFGSSTPSLIIDYFPSE